MKSLFDTLSVIAAVLMVLCILLQSRGQGLGTAWGGNTDNNFYRSKRGAELVLYNATIILAVVFVLSVLLSILSKG